MEEIIFELEDLDGPTSPTRSVVYIEQTPDAPVAAVAAPEAALSPVEKLLADPKLPELEREDRARLLIQSPTRLFFYWTLGSNPFQVLERAFGGKASYSLSMRLVEIGSDNELLQRIETEGSLWFDVMPDTEYRAEVGFYAPNQPFVRVMFSNTVRTPRKGPSQRPATEARWAVSEEKFVEVLDVSGFVGDAMDVALASEEVRAAVPAFAAFFEIEAESVSKLPSDELGRVISALAAGEPLEAIKWDVGPELWAVLQANYAKFTGPHGPSPGRPFEIESAEQEILGPAVFGMSLVHFPKRSRGRRPFPRYAPLSSGDRG